VKELALGRQDWVVIRRSSIDNKAVIRGHTKLPASPINVGISCRFGSDKRWIGREGFFYPGQSPCPIKIDIPRFAMGLGHMPGCIPEDFYPIPFWVSEIN
jgi:hypothetical protein